jgi:Protein kinase domain
MASSVATSATGSLPGLARNNSIDPSSLSRPARRLRGAKRGQQNNGALHDSNVSTVSSAHDSQSSAGSKWESVKFSAKNFVVQKAGILEDFYDLGDLIGEGGFGEVYACTHLETGEKRAVKVMEKSMTKKSINDNIIREYYILKDLDHPK